MDSWFRRGRTNSDLEGVVEISRWLSEAIPAASVRGLFPTLEGNAVNYFRLEHSGIGPLSPGTPGERVGVRGLASRAKSGHLCKVQEIGYLQEERYCARDANPPHPDPLPRSTGGEGEMQIPAESVSKTIHGVALRGRNCRPSMYLISPVRANFARREGFSSPSRIRAAQM